MQFLEDEKMKIALPLQAYAWPAILRGMNLVGITPPRKMSIGTGGKTTAYLPALVTQLMQIQKYSKLSQGSGVSLIINSGANNKYLMSET